MNKFLTLFMSMGLLGLTLMTTGCHRKGDDVWEDTKSCSRHMGRGVRTLGGKHGDSRQVQCRDDFATEGGRASGKNAAVAMSDDFVPLEGSEIAMSDPSFRQPRETPGEAGSSIPNIDSFVDPITNPAWASVFRQIRFGLNSSLIKGQDNLGTIRNIADYMKSNDKVCIFVEGHCDERGPEAFNLALGSHRSNSVRSVLIKEGVSPDNIFTISYGKERPLDFGHIEESWSKNRRAEFKVYERR